MQSGGSPQKGKKWFPSSKKYEPGSSIRIPETDADFLPSRIRNRITVFHKATFR
jgi:hypothetical protein